MTRNLVRTELGLAAISPHSRTAVKFAINPVFSFEYAIVEGQPYWVEVMLRKQNGIWYHDPDHRDDNGIRISTLDCDAPKEAAKKVVEVAILVTSCWEIENPNLLSDAEIRNLNAEIDYLKRRTKSLINQNKKLRERIRNLENESKIAK
jgi:predicted ATPase